MSHTPISGRLQRDDGATAIVTALVAVILFGMAALAVEITDMYSRDRASQTTADLAALSGAQGLPGVCEAFDRTLETLNRPENAVADDTSVGGYAATQQQMRDGDATNGEIWVLRDHDDTATPAFGAADVLATTACDGSLADTEAAGGEGRYVRVVTPPRTIDFAFTAVLPGAPTEGSVQASATVGLRSPSIGDTLPLFLPDGCISGPKKIITESPGRIPSTSTPNYRPNQLGNNPQNNSPVVDSVTSSEIIGGIVQQVTVTVSNLRTNPASRVLPASTVIFDFHNGTGTTTVRYPANTPVGAGARPESVTVSSTTGTGTAQRWVAVYEVELPNQLTSVGGDWWVRAKEDTTNARDGWTKTAEAKDFSVNALAAPGCNDPSTGDFGFLRADRNDTGNSNSGELALNFIEGVEFTVEAFPRPLAVGTSCSGDDSPMDARVSTSNPARDGANCLDIESGRNGGNVTDGLIEGEGGKDGRLRARTSPAGLPAGCVEPGDSTPDYQWRTPTNPAVDIWNTQLSCYLPGGQPLSALETCDSCLDPAILADPRYFIVPILNETIRPSSSTQWPIKEFRGAFITDEVTRGDATCASARVCNGLEFNNGLQTVFSVQVYVFPLSENTV